MEFRGKKWEVVMDSVYPAKLKLQVRWADMDAFSHVNNAHYFRYFEMGRFNYFDEMGIPVVADVYPVIAHAQCEFRKPVVYPANAMVEVGVMAMNRGSCIIGHKITVDGRVHAKGDVTVVWLDSKTHRSTQVSQELWDTVMRFEQEAGSKIVE